LSQLSDIPETPEAEAEGKVKAVFDDVKSTLGMPSVGLLFRQLAVYPWFLQLAWRNLKPNASIVYFRRMSSEVRDLALQLAGGSRSRTTSADAYLSSLDALLDIYARLLLATAALRSGVNGQVPKMSWISPDDKRTIDSREAANGAVTQQQLNSALASAGAGVESDSVLEARAAELRERAAVMAEALPYRMEVSATSCRQAGLTEDQIDAVRNILDSTWRALPRALVTLAGTPSRTEPVSKPSEPPKQRPATGSVAVA
jgi:hypothetical protein